MLIFEINCYICLSSNLCLILFICACRVNTARATPTWMGRASTRRRLSSPSCYWPSCLSNSTSRFPTLGYLSCGTISFQILPRVYYTPPFEQAAIQANPATNTPSLYVQFTVVFIHHRIDHTAAVGWERTMASVGGKTRKPRSCCRLCSDCQPGPTSNLSAMPASK